MDRDALKKEANERLADARRQKNVVERDIREAYFFFAPQRLRVISSLSAAPITPARSEDAAELQTSLGIEVGGDFATEVASTLMPQSVEWAQQKAAPDLPEDEWDAVKEDVEEQTTKIHDAIKASNFYPAVATTFEGDLPHGTVAMWISDLRSTEPAVCQPIPARELEINIGPYGTIDDRFIVRATRYRYLPALLTGVELPKSVVERMKKKPNDRCKVTWGFWRDWTEDREVVWQAVITVEKEVVDHGRLVGIRACPIVIGRWSPDPTLAWGVGPRSNAFPNSVASMKPRG